LKAINRRNRFWTLSEHWIWSFKYGDQITESYSTFERTKEVYNVLKTTGSLQFLIIKHKIVDNFLTVSNKCLLYCKKCKSWIKLSISKSRVPQDLEKDITLHFSIFNGSLSILYQSDKTFNIVQTYKLFLHHHLLTDCHKP